MVPASALQMFVPQFGKKLAARSLENLFQQTLACVFPQSICSALAQKRLPLFAGLLAASNCWNPQAAQSTTVDCWAISKEGFEVAQDLRPSSVAISTILRQHFSQRCATILPDIRYH